MKTINIGIIGVGRIGRLHAENLVRMPNVSIRCVCDVNPDPARAWASGLGIPHVTGDYRELLQHPEIDAVFICCSTDSHVEVIVEASRAGKHIFCEKPVSMDFRMTKIALSAVEEAGVLFQVGFNRRYDHNFRRLHELLQEGRIGEPHIVKITSRDPSPPPKEYIKVSGGLFIDMAIHDFDMARFMAGGDVEEVYAQGAVLVDPVFAEYGDIDTAVTTLKFKNGVLAVIDNSRKAEYGYDQRVELFGSKGSITAGNDFPNSAELMTVQGVYRDKPLHFFLERYNEAYIREASDFIESVRENKGVRVNGYDGLQAELIAHAAKISLLEKRPVRIDEIV